HRSADRPRDGGGGLRAEALSQVARAPALPDLRTALSLRRPGARAGSAPRTSRPDSARGTGRGPAAPGSRTSEVAAETISLPEGSAVAQLEAGHVHELLDHAALHVEGAAVHAALQAPVILKDVPHQTGLGLLAP